MSHYGNRKPAKTQDLVQVVSAYGPQRVLGIIVSINAGSESCNAQLLPLARKWNDGPWYPISQPYPDCVSLNECWPVVPEGMDSKEAPPL